MVIYILPNIANFKKIQINTNQYKSAGKGTMGLTF